MVKLSIFKRLHQIFVFLDKSILISKKIRPRKETFEQAIQRANLSEDDLKKLSRRFIHQVYLYLGATFFGFIYAFYLLFNVNIVSGLLVIMLALYLIIKAYRAHFWYFEIKNRKLGCGFREWLRGE